MILRAILYRLRQGCSWRALSIFAPFSTIYTRWRQWNDSGVWDALLKVIQSKGNGKLWAVDSTSSKVHKHGFGASEPSDCECIGKSRGGSNTKIHALVDSKGKAIRILLTSGSCHDIIAAPDLVYGQTGRTILADKAYDSEKFRQLLSALELKACIPPKTNRVEPASYHKGHYKHRHKVENFFQRIKELRAIATRYEKHDFNFLSLVNLAAICDWM